MLTTAVRNTSIFNTFVPIFNVSEATQSWTPYLCCDSPHANSSTAWLQETLFQSVEA